MYIYYYLVDVEIQNLRIDWIGDISFIFICRFSCIYTYLIMYYIYILSFFDFMRSFFKANKPTSHGSNALKLGQTNKNRPIWIFRQWHRDRGVPGGAPGYPDLIHRLGEVHFDIPRVPFSKSFNSDHRRRPLKVDFPNKYPLCRVYMGLIIKGTVPKGITIFPIFFWWVFLESHWWPKNKISLTLPETNICFLLGWPIFKGELLVLGECTTLTTFRGHSMGHILGGIKWGSKCC